MTPKERVTAVFPTAFCEKGNRFYPPQYEVYGQGKLLGYGTDAKRAWIDALNTLRAAKHKRDQK